MSKTILAEVNGFTPVIDVILKDVGVMSAVVFGRMWRYCQMKDGVCNASLETIANELSVDRTTVIKHIATLIEHGYLKDHTPDLRNRPHTYSDSGKAGLGISLDAKVPPIYGGVNQEPGVGNSNTNAQAYVPGENVFMQVHEEGVVNLDSTVENSDSTVENSDTASSRNFRHEDRLREESIKELRKGEVLKKQTSPSLPERRTAAVKKGDLFDGMIAYSQPPGQVDCSDFPEDLRPLVQKMCDLWNLHPPLAKTSDYHFWVKGARSLSDACGEFGVDAIEAAYYANLREPITVSNPGSLVQPCRYQAGKLRKSRPHTLETEKPEMTPELRRVINNLNKLSPSVNSNA
jgi:DNA-binding Lrp family transcriptional regulator